MPPTIPQSLVTGYQVHMPGRDVTPEEAFAQFLLDLRQQMKRTAQRAYDFSHPVDEYQSGPGIPSSLAIEVQPTYQLFSERIEYCLVIIGSTATGVVFQLGDRYIPLSPAINSNQPIPAVTQPAVPASTVNQQNANPFPVQVVITGGTITVVSVNGLQVGTGAGTYTVPAGGTISITYSVAPTWAWSAYAFNFQASSPQSFSGYYAFDCGFVLKPHERRLLTATSWGNTNGFYVGLFGHASDVFETV